MAKPTGAQKPILFPISRLQAIKFEACPESAPQGATPHGDQEALILSANLIIALEAQMDRIFNSRGADDDALKHERACYVHALKAISSFFKQLGIRKYDRRFYRLAVAIDGLNRGSVDPLLMERQVSD
jgi:hypothetical protein